MLREADKGFLYIGKQISRSLKNESLSGLVPIYDHSLVILADEDEEAALVVFSSSEAFTSSESIVFFVSSATFVSALLCSY